MFAALAFTTTFQRNLPGKHISTSKMFSVPVHWKYAEYKIIIPFKQKDLTDVLIRSSDSVFFDLYALFISFHDIDRQFVLCAQGCHADLRRDLLGDLAQGICHRRIWMRYQNRFAAVAADAYVLVNGHLAEEIGLRSLRQLLAAARAEDVHTCAVGQVKIGHVLDDAKDGHFQRAEHVQSAAGIFQRDQLREGHDHRAAEGQRLRQ